MSWAWEPMALPVQALLVHDSWVQLAFPVQALLVRDSGVQLASPIHALLVRDSWVQLASPIQALLVRDSWVQLSLMAHQLLLLPTDGTGTEACLPQMGSSLAVGKLRTTAAEGLHKKTELQNSAADRSTVEHAAQKTQSLASDTFVGLAAHT